MSIYKRHRFPSEIIQYAVWAYYRFNLSHRDVEDLLAQRGVIVSHETIRRWCRKFGRIYTKRLRQTPTGFGDTYFIDEVFVNINGKRQYLWRAVDQDGDIVDVLVQRYRNAKAAKRFFRRLIQSNQGVEPRRIVTDKLKSYQVSHRELMSDVIHDTSQYENNKSELSHQPTRVRERVMRRFKSRSQAQAFVNHHASVYNLFNHSRHLISAKYYRKLRSDSFETWKNTAAA